MQWSGFTENSKRINLRIAKKNRVLLHENNNNNPGAGEITPGPMPCQCVCTAAKDGKFQGGHWQQSNTEQFLLYGKAK
jgi:hypothetical protein